VMILITAVFFSSGVMAHSGAESSGNIIAAIFHQLTSIDHGLIWLVVGLLVFLYYRRTGVAEK